MPKQNIRKKDQYQLRQKVNSTELCTPSVSQMSKSFFFPNPDSLGTSYSQKSNAYNSGQLLHQTLKEAKERKQQKENQERNREEFISASVKNECGNRTNQVLSKNKFFQNVSEMSTSTRQRQVCR